MIVLYTEFKGGEWIPFNTPMDEKEVRRAIKAALSSHRYDWPAVFGGDEDGQYSAIFIPQGDTLPKFYSILLPGNSRWDAEHLEWFQFYRTPEQEADRLRYLAGWKPWETLEDRLKGDNWWIDQGHPDAEMKESVRRLYERD